MLEPVDSLVSSPNAYALLGTAYALLAVPTALFPHAVRMACIAPTAPHVIAYMHKISLLLCGLPTTVMKGALVLDAASIMGGCLPLLPAIRRADLRRLHSETVTDTGPSLRDGGLFDE